MLMNVCTRDLTDKELSDFVLALMAHGIGTQEYFTFVERFIDINTAEPAVPHIEVFINAINTSNTSTTERPPSRGGKHKPDTGDNVLFINTAGHRY